jgi:hypothetical protein
MGLDTDLLSPSIYLSLSLSHTHTLSLSLSLVLSPFLSLWPDPFLLLAHAALEVGLVPDLLEAL